MVTISGDVVRISGDYLWLNRYVNVNTEIYGGYLGDVVANTMMWWVIRQNMVVIPRYRDIYGGYYRHAVANI